MNYLTDEITEQLEQYQITQLNMQIQDYLETNVEANQFVHHYCPKCGVKDRVCTKGGFTQKGKQMMRCTTCKKRFVVDHGQLTFYSHQSQSSWNAVMLDSLNEISLSATAAKINIHVTTAFRMRHKFMNSLKIQEDAVVLNKLIKIDEMYVLESLKGQKSMHRKSRKRGTPATKRGLSDQQICIIMAIERDGQSFIRTYNNAKPSFDEIRI